MDNTSKHFTVSFVTLGCRVNQYESDVIAAELKSRGVTVVPFGDRCDLAVVNTCSVTSESDKKSRQMIHRGMENAEKVVITGCYAQLSGDAVSHEKVTYVCGNSGKASLADIIMDILNGIRVEKLNVTPPDDMSAVRSVLTVPMRTRSYIKIEDGCDNRCSYCIINRARGPVRSKDPATVINEASVLSASGTSEIILTGIETGAYGADFDDRRPYGQALADLVKELDGIETVKRIGLASLDPSVFSERFVDTISGAGKLLPHFHLSLQSGSSRVLAAMRRRYNADMAMRSVERIKKAIPGVTLSADVIVGFPGETDEEFLETVSFCRTAEFLHLHIFPFSPRKGTEAASMDGQIPYEVKKERARILKAEGESVKAALLERYVRSHGNGNDPVSVLVEKSYRNSFSGHSEHFVEVSSSGRAKVGEIVQVFLDRVDGRFCRGEKA